MLKYLETQDESLCCGCRACEQICPVNAILMLKNKEGFYYPVLDEKICINCGLCEKVCPEMDRPLGKEPIEIYAIQHKNDDILKESSSGGAFRLLADEIIKNAGCVVGCIWDENYQPILTIADTIEELLPMQGSKYLSSNTLDVYTQVKERLKKGQKVLFTGAPCQCAGLIKYLGKEYENLLTADFLCHGMPSQEIFNQYLDTVENNLGLAKNKNSRKITSYKFRDKSKKGWGHVSSYTWVNNSKEYKRYSIGKTDEYDYGFLKGYFNRYSCYSCNFRGKNRFTDFTFCDYWGIQNYHPEFISTKGVSALSINTLKGKSFFEKIKEKTIYAKTDLKNVAIENPSLLHEEIETIPLERKKMYEMLKKLGWQSVAKKYFRPKNYFLYHIWYFLPKWLTKLIKKF